MRAHSSALIGSLAVICAYMLVRAGIYHFFPVTSEETWFWRDNLMCIPRLGGFAALLFLNRRWKISRFDLQPKDFGRALMMGVVPVGLWIFYLSAGQGETVQTWMKLVGIFSSLAVGLFEECAFRGPLLLALRGRFSLFNTIVLSNVLFCLYHIQAQSLRYWGAIFLTGVIYANLRFRGLSLGWLALIHGFTDASAFFLPSEPPNPFGLRGIIFQIALLIYAVASYPRRKEIKN